ncbi:MAG: hypothetical protein CUN52_02935 [Phototrophicales bacterium]|nr:MAG: hypothetical protein CUN52_02935 [Phototrophicales bacterium]
MSVSAAPMPVRSVDQSRFWLRDKRWDLMFITASVIFVPIPYLVYLLLSSGGMDQHVARNAVNAFVGIAIGGPHMMSTFLRTGLDANFKQRYPMLLRSSIIIPVVVVSLAFLNLTLLLTVFFFWAALHVLHQVTYIVELYNHKETHLVRKSAVSLYARLVDYAVILTCLFPLAAFKISQGAFEIGTNDLTAVIPDFFQADWFFYMMAGVFGVALVAYIAKTYQEYRGGYLNLPKTIFISFTVAVAFTMPALENLDTAFQGLNTWHSFQYLAITFYIIKIKEQHGKLDGVAPLVKRFAQATKDSRGLYLLSTIMLVGSLVIFALVFLLAHIITPNPALLNQNIPLDQAIINWRFDVAYYTAILSFLWIHYYHDHFLFTDFEVLEDAY